MTLGLATSLGAVFVAEVVTPNDVVSALSLLPVIAAMWLLSARQAFVIGSTATLFFVVSLFLEPDNRVTLMAVGVAVGATAALVRVYAAALAGIVGSGPHVSGLTQRELEVALLAGQAYTAAEIGARLHIGERTVESHLSNTYLKLRISSRRELIRMVSRLAPPP